MVRSKPRLPRPLRDKRYGLAFFPSPWRSAGRFSSSASTSATWRSRSSCLPSPSPPGMEGPGPPCWRLCSPPRSSTTSSPSPFTRFYISGSDLPYFIVFATFASLVTWFSAVRRRVEERPSSSSRPAPDRSGGANPAGQPAESHARHDFRPRYERRHHVLESGRPGVVRLDAGGSDRQALSRASADGLSGADRARFARSCCGPGVGRANSSTRKADGTEVVVASRWSLRRDEQERPAAILETNNDITERKRREEEIQQPQRGTRQSEPRSSKPPIRNWRPLPIPFRTICARRFAICPDSRNCCKKMRRPLLNEKSQRYVTMILESAKRMGNLIDDLLAFSRIGRAETHKTHGQPGATCAGSPEPKSGRRPTGAISSGRSAHCPPGTETAPCCGWRSSI